MTKDIPRGVEVLVKKAAVDPEFKALLLAERSGAAAVIGLELSEAEAAMLDGVPGTQLETIIANTTVSPKMRPAFTGRVAAVMLAALGTAVVTFAEQVESDETKVARTRDITTFKPGAEIETGVIAGTVTDENGDPVMGALVVIYTENVYATTNRDGYYEISDLVDGSYDIYASRVGYSKESVVGAVVIAGQAITVSFILKSQPPSTHVITGSRP